MNQKKQCRVCGKEYESCRTHASRNGVFRWREVACSPECGSVYLQRIQESRGLTEKMEPVEIDAESEVNTGILEPNRD